jgi:hypothetical protein
MEISCLVLLRSGICLDPAGGWVVLEPWGLITVPVELGLNYSF